MKTFFCSLSVLIAIIFSSASVFAAPKEIYTDPETGHEVWRMTNNTGNDVTMYYHNPSMSPNGKYIAFKTNRSPYMFLIRTDGTGEVPLGTSSGWGSGVYFSETVIPGWWSNDSKTFYAYSNLKAIDIESYLAGNTSDSYMKQISPTYAANFYNVMLSPDGRTLFGMSNKYDSSSGATLKLINIDGTNYRAFPIPFYYWGNTEIDVSHGWLGNNEAWYLNNSPTYEHIETVFDVNTGQYKGILVIDDHDGDMWDGIFDHPTLSPSAYFIGGEEGRIAGNGRGLLSANTKYWYQNNTDRQLIVVGSKYGDHSNFNADASLLMVGGNSGMYDGYIITHRVSANGSIEKIVKYGYSSNNGGEPYASWSPDGTKIVYSSNISDGVNTDIYQVVYKKPDIPASLVAENLGGGQMRLTWKTARQHREIKEYQVYGSTSQNGSFSQTAAVPSLYTYLDAPSKISSSATSINVDSTAGFPDRGTIEIFGLSSERSTEIVNYTGKTATSFTGLTRGVMNSTAAEHWNDSFVWLYSGSHGYQGGQGTNSWFKVRSVEWSGLTSEFSSPVSVGGSVPVSPTPGVIYGDADGDGDVDENDYNIWRSHYNPTTLQSGGSTIGDFNSSGIVDGLDYVIWLNGINTPR